MGVQEIETQPRSGKKNEHLLGQLLLVNFKKEDIAMPHTHLFLGVGTGKSLGTTQALSAFTIPLVF